MGISGEDACGCGHNGGCLIDWADWVVAIAVAIIAVAIFLALWAFLVG